MNTSIAEYDIIVIAAVRADCPPRSRPRGRARRCCGGEKRLSGRQPDDWMPLLAYLDKDGNPGIRGIAQEFIDELAKKHAVSPHHWCPMHDSVTIYDHEVFKIVAFEIA